MTIKFLQKSPLIKPKRVLFLVAGKIKGGLSPASRFRVYAYLPKFNEDKRFKVRIRPSIPPRNFYERVFFKKHILLAKFLIPLGLLLMFIARVFDILYSFFFDVVVIQKPFFPGKTYPFLELLICKFNHCVVFDFDDAIFMYRTKESTYRKGLFYQILKDGDNVARIIQNVRHVIPGNKYLSNYTNRYNKHLTIIPTPIDTDYYKPAHKNNIKQSEKITIGWIGTSGNLLYLENLSYVFSRLQKEHDFTLKVISDPPAQKWIIEGVAYEWHDWSLDSELRHLLSFDIGIMPLEDNEWTRGKCGFKLLQYMACEIPVVASPVGVNAEIINDVDNGFLAETLDDWYAKLKKLITHDDLRNSLGKKGRELVLSKYSLDNTYPLLSDVLMKISQVKK